MAATKIEDLFNRERFPNGWYFLSSLLFFPIGFLLGFVRIFISLHTLLVSSILSKMSQVRRIVLRCMCGVLGFIVTHDGMEHLDPSAKILISNHVSALDHLAVELIIPNIVAGSRHIPGLIRWALSYKDLGANISKDVFILKCKEHCKESNIPILIHPEGASTNGRKGLLKFSSWPFSIGEPVQPIIIHVSRPPIAQISPSVLGSQWLSDFVWSLFVPFSHYKLRLLPVQYKEETETIEEFTHRVQNLLSKELGQENTPFSSADKAECLKKIIFGDSSERSAQNRVFVSSVSVQSTSSSNNNSDISFSSQLTSSFASNIFLMVDQVKDVLPNVPHDIIQEDLAKTKCVDTTITNILEGRTSYSQQNVNITDKYAPFNSKEVASTSKTFDVKPQTPTFSTFGKTPSERMSSYKERKAALIENARKRYLEKYHML